MPWIRMSQIQLLVGQIWEIYFYKIGSSLGTANREFHSVRLGFKHLYKKNVVRFRNTSLHILVFKLPFRLFETNQLK